MSYFDTVRINELIAEAEGAIKRLELKAENAEDGWSTWSYSDQVALDFWTSELQRIQRSPADALRRDAAMGDRLTA